jgi:hypothetical protein
VIEAALAVQLVLAFLAPIIPWGTRHIFPADLFCLLWVPLGLIAFLRRRSVGKNAKRQLLTWLAACAALLGVVYLHGYFRPPVASRLNEISFYVKTDSDVFQPGRELVFVIRFLGWLGAAGLVAMLEMKRETISRLLKTLVACIAVITALMILAKLSLSFREALAAFYSYDLKYDVWENRAYGTFPSPVEAGAALGLALVLLAGADKQLLPRAWRLTGLACGVVALLLTHTMTAMVALAGTGVLARIRMRRKFHWGWIAAPGVLFAGVILSPGFFASKATDLFARVEPWRVMLRGVFSRWDLALLGFGFPNYTADNSFVFVLVRAGLLGAAFLAWALLWIRARRWARWSPAQGSILVYLLITATMFDVIIYRNVVYLMIAIGIPLLRGPKLKS